MTPGAAEIVAAIRGWQTEHPGSLVIAIDGYGASGKSTIAAEVERAADAMVVHTDDYYEALSQVDDPHPMAPYYRWESLRREGLEPILEAGAGLILVEGVSSAAAALADLMTHTVFVATPEPVRLSRLHERISDAEWDEAWLAAERRYFASRPPDWFNLVVPGA